MNTRTAQSKTNWRTWLQAARPFSFTASMVPVFVGAALVPYLQRSARWSLLPLIAAAALSIHAATNMVSEYFDFQKGVDRPDTYGGSRVLVDHLLAPRQVLTGGIVLFVVTACIGLIFIAIHGWPILLLGVIGMFGGLFYTAVPVGYKYLGLGDLCVFVLMGPLMVLGSFYVLTGTWHSAALWVSLPVGCLVAAILSANNLRDIQHDTRAGIRSTATVLGRRAARLEYAGLVLAAFAGVAVMIGFEVLPWWALLTGAALPGALHNIGAAYVGRLDRPRDIATLDIRTAQVHLLFGILLMASLLAGAFL